ncbi:MAG: RNA-binding S4 domain-containing protein [Dysgonamonadaceae bacterium]|jgi:ribosome-associated heat shock protein Hsp15|nr:RNA-binding S4 domain-containing protein [Dysgonamonadaceae bacterium]
MDETGLRVDKWLWAVRIFKTRTIALEECRKNRVTVNSAPAKPSRLVKVGDTVTVRKPPVTYTFKVLAVTDSRVSAKLATGYVEDITPAEQHDLRFPHTDGFINRKKGAGRPTKKERRELDGFFEL